MTHGFLSNAFSLSMLPLDTAACEVRVTVVDLAEARRMAPTLQSYVGHADTAQMFAAQLGCDVAMHRASLHLNRGDVILVGQYVGPRLAEGTRTLPDGAEIRWLRVDVAPPARSGNVDEPAQGIDPRGA